MKFDLTLTTVLVFFVPGGLFLLGVPFDLLHAVDRWGIVEKPKSLEEAGVLLSAIFFCGAMIDSLRTITIQPVVSYCAKWRGSVLPDGYFRAINKDSIVVYELISEKSFEYLRLNQNITLALFALCIFRVLDHGKDMMWVCALLSGIVWLAISVNSKMGLDKTLNGFVQASSTPRSPDEHAVQLTVHLE